MSVPHPFHEFPKHLYADGQPAVQVHNTADEKKYRDLGYGDQYVYQAYPKAMHKKVAGQVVSVAARNRDEEKEFASKGWVTADKV